MKIKDIDEDRSLTNIRFIYPGDQQTYYWVSQWNRGVWGKKDLNDSRIYPLMVNDLKECLEWEIVQ